MAAFFIENLIELLTNKLFLEKRVSGHQLNCISAPYSCEFSSDFVVF